MKYYDLLSTDEIKTLDKVRTKICFQDHGQEECLKFFQKEDFKFNDLISVPDYLKIPHGFVVAQALLTYFTNYGISDRELGREEEQILKELGVTVPEDASNFFLKCVRTRDKDELDYLYNLGAQYWNNKMLADVVTEIGFMSEYWGTPSECIGYSAFKDKHENVVILETLAKPPLPWLKVFSQLFPAITFAIKVDDKDNFILSNAVMTACVSTEEWLSATYMEKQIETPVKKEKDSTVSPRLSTMGIF